MHYRQLGKTDLNVSEIGLGTMTFGEQNSASEGHQQLDMAVDHGVNFIDTAEMYSIPPRAETYGATERIIGSWLHKTGKRDQVILASKVVGKSDWLPYIREAKACLDMKNINQAVEESLRRLQTDYMDLYQVHWPDRKTNFFGQLGYRHEPDQAADDIAQTLEALSALVKAGKVRHIGVSNETPWGVMKYLRLSEKLDFPRIVSIQNPFNLLNRSFEIGLAEISHREQLGLLAYSPMAFGVLSGKYLNNSPDNARLTLFPGYQRYSNKNGIAATREYVAIAKRHDLSPGQMALAFVSSRPFVSSNIIGATTLVQLKENLECVHLELSQELLAQIDEVHQRYSNPCP